MQHTGSPPFRSRLRWQSLCSNAVLLFLLCINLAEAQKSGSDYLVTSLPGAPSPLLKMWAGHVEISPQHHGNMFFWLYKSRQETKSNRTVLWLNGGPGCSSMDGALMEIGPYRVKDDGTLRYNDGSWDEFSNILFVDNPVGTGFSYVDGDSLLHDLDEMASQMMTFLEKWFALFPEHAEDELFIAGESYAGQHIPYIAKAIQDRNEKKARAKPWNLKGLLIGNGWISGPEQYLSYIPFGYETGILESGSEADKNARLQEKLCIQALEKGGKDHVDIITCEMIMQSMNKDLGGKEKCFNVYDVRLKDVYPSCGMNWPPDLASVTPYLRRDDVTNALHINKDKMTGWKECNGQVSGAFNAQHSEPSIRLLPGLLEKMPIILFSGDKDLICNHIGTEQLIQNMEWSGEKGMESSKIRNWTVEGESAGTWREARNLTYIRFYDSSHMVPFDYPKRTRDMLDRFTGVDFASSSGKAIESHIDDENESQNAGSGKPNSKPDSEPEQQKPEEEEKDSRWITYRRSGEAALVVVVIAACVWGYFILRERRRRKGYKGVFGSDPYEDGGRSGGVGLGINGSGLRNKHNREDRDIEAAAAFDESELDELNANGHKEEDRFSLGDDEEEEHYRDAPPGRSKGG